MEAIILEVLEFPIGVAFTGLLLLVGVAAAVAFGYAATEEKAGARLFWAEWPIPERMPAAERKVRLAA